MDHTPGEIASAISSGHSFVHVERGEFGESARHGPDTGVVTHDDFSQHIYSTILDTETLCFRTMHGHDIFYNADTNTMIAYDPQHKDLGTCFRPTARGQKFDREFGKNVENGGKPDFREIRRGFVDLQRYHSQTKNRGLKQGRSRSNEDHRER